MRLVPYEEEAIEIPVPQSVRTRAEEIVQLSRRLGEQGVGFRSPRDVLAPALVYGLAHMRERYSQAALQAGRLTQRDGP